MVPTIFNAVKRVLVGRPFRNDNLAHTLLPKRIALPVFASDALSSVAYAPDEILLTLALAGVSAVAFSPWVGLAVMVVLLTVVASYRQNVHAYPSGGGDYEIANENLGKYAGLTVASALLVDYVLTVAVSMSSAATYLTTAVPSLHGQQAGIATIGVVILALVNLRGIKEAGTRVRPADLYLHGVHPRHDRHRRLPGRHRPAGRGALGGLHDCSRAGLRRRPGRPRRRVPAAPGVLLRRRRVDRH